jgi:preprotein translocase subunit SecA
MDRLGIEEGESIESRMVTRAVENAQKKVENLHFESRKHLLEYDDVANQQRKTIYNFRNDLLNPEFDISTKIEEIRSEYILSALQQSEIFEGALKEEYDLERLCALLLNDMGLDLDVQTLNNKDFDAIVETINSALKEEYETKMSVVDAIQRNEIERILYLQVLDNAWREHLYQMDILKTGIGLRGYNQKDPLTEYKKESYNLFMELVERIKFESIKTLQRIRLRDEKAEEEKAAMEAMVRRMEAQQNEGATYGRPNEEGSIPAEKKIPRNDPCPCGSGKKYKQCCGKSGPKRGLLA